MGHPVSIYEYRDRVFEPWHIPCGLRVERSAHLIGEWVILSNYTNREIEDSIPGISLMDSMCNVLPLDSWGRLDRYLIAK